VTHAEDRDRNNPICGDVPRDNHDRLESLSLEQRQGLEQMTSGWQQATGYQPTSTAEGQSTLAEVLNPCLVSPHQKSGDRKAKGSRKRRIG